MKTDPNKPNLLQCFIPILFLIAMLTINVIIFESDSSYGANQIALIFSAGMAALIGMNLGFTWKQMLDGIVKSISSAMGAILILLVIYYFEIINYQQD